MKNSFLYLFSALFSLAGYTQVVNTGMVDNYDSVEVGKIAIGGLVDCYYGFDFNQPAGSQHPYFVSSARHNEFNINLAAIDVKYKNSLVRSHLVAGFGTYINDNYTAEQGTLKNLIEANVGVKLSKKREIWLDAGILGSPYTNETPISKDHLMYTRSMGPEFAPYYLAGMKLGAELNKKWNAYLYLVNGWQQIANLNKGFSVATQLEFRPNDSLLINWDTYIGDESSPAHPEYGMRYFTDLYLIYKPEGKFSLTSSVYVGSQQVEDSLGSQNGLVWWQANLIADIRFRKRSSLSARVEYFSDPSSVQAVPVTSQIGFETGSLSLGYKLKFSENALFRLENRFFLSSGAVFYDPDGNPTDRCNWLVASLTAWF